MIMGGIDIIEDVTFVVTGVVVITVECLEWVTDGMIQDHHITTKFNGPEQLSFVSFRYSQVDSTPSLNRFNHHVILCILFNLVRDLAAAMMSYHPTRESSFTVGRIPSLDSHRTREPLPGQSRYLKGSITHSFTQYRRITRSSNPTLPKVTIA